MGKGFDSKCDFTPPTILLWLLLCSWMWGIVFGGSQHSSVDGCSAASCNFGVDTGEDERTSFHPAILHGSKRVHTPVCVQIYLLPIVSMMVSDSSASVQRFTI